MMLEPVSTQQLYLLDNYLSATMLLNEHESINIPFAISYDYTNNIHCLYYQKL